MQFISYTYPGLESILRKELEKRKILVNEIWPGFVIFSWDVSTLIKANLWLRTANKVYILLKSWKVESFDDLFDIVYSIDWKYFLNSKLSFYISVNSIKSKLNHIPSVQSITQKAIIKKLVWDKKYIFQEDKLEIRIDIFKDDVKILLDTSWDPLYKRWYKIQNSKASLKETLAAGIILLSNCKQSTFYDPFCGSGTIVIEKAMIDLNIAPGLKRNFIFEKFDWIDLNILEKEKWRAQTRQKNKELKFFAYDIDEQMVNITKENIKNAWLEKYVEVCQKNYLDTNISYSMITNPPYGKRIKSEKIEKIYGKLFKDLKNVDCWWVITSYKLSKDWFDIFKVRVLSNWWERVNYFYR
jgi:putative N6-adenine-specific DNA methylase